MKNPSEDTLDRRSVTLFPPLDDDDDSGLSAQLAENFHRVTKRRRSESFVVSDDSEEEEIRQLALETAFMAHLEIQHMKNSIAELESLLRQSEGPDEDESNGSNGIVSRNQIGNDESESLTLKSESSR